MYMYQIDSVTQNNYIAIFWKPINVTGLEANRVFLGKEIQMFSFEVKNVCHFRKLS